MLILLDRTDQYPDFLCLFKSADAEPGTRWITVHPNGKDEEGHAVLIRESHTSPGTWHVIGGADGKLNHMTLDHIGTRAEWNQRAKDKRAKAKAEGKQATPETQAAVKEANKKNRIAFVNKVADTLGWDKNWYKTAEDYIRENPTLETNKAAAGMLANDNLNAYHKKAKEAVGQYKRRMIADAEARSQAGLGDLSLDNNPFRATAAEIDDAHVKDRILHHGDQATEAQARENVMRDTEAKAYEGLAGKLDTMPDDATSTDIGQVVAGLGQPNTDEARAILARLRVQDIDPAQAAGQLRKVAGDVRADKVEMTGGGQAKHHEEVGGLYKQAQAAIQNGDEDEAARYIEHAKKLTGDYNVGALDLVGEKASEGKGYKPVERQRAREDIASRGEDTPEAIGQKLEEVARHRAELSREPTDRGPVLDYAAKEQETALRRAHEAAREGDATKAQDYLLEAQKYEVYEQDLDGKIEIGDDGQLDTAKARGAIEARRKILAAHAARSAVKATGGVGGGSGGGGGGGGTGGGTGRQSAAKVSDETLDMGKALGLMKAEGAYRERQKQLAQAKKDASIDPDAFKTALKDDRVDETPLADADVDKILDRIKELGNSKIHSDLIDMVENPGVFQAAAGEDQVRAGSIGKWVDMGRDAAMNLIGQLAGSGLEVDRAKLATLGIKDGAALLAQHIANTMTDQKRREILAGLGRYHSGRAANVASEAMRAAQECLVQATEFERGGKVNAYDLSEMAHYNRLRMECVDQALASVGTAYGELNATAEMIWALGGARKRADVGYTLKGGVRDREGLVVLARSLGLDPEEYTVNSPTYDPDTKTARPGGVSLSPEGAKKIFRRKGMGQQVRETNLQQIKAGDQDGDNYLPRGIARRPASIFDDPEKRPDQYAMNPDWKGVDFSGPEGEIRLKDHLAERLADGMSPQQLYAEMHSQRMMAPHLQPGQQTDQYRAALTRIFPSPDDEHWRADMDDWAQDIVGKGNTLNSQTIDETDPRTVEAAHRALARNPHGIYAFKDAGDLGAADQAKIRDYAYKNLWGVTGDRPEDKDAAQAPPPATDAMGNVLGDTLPKGTPKDPQGNHWNAFVERMGNSTAAYTAILHHIRGDTMRQFAETYGQVTGTALRTGSEAIPGGGRFYQHHADDATARRIEDAASASARPDRIRGTLARQSAAQHPQVAMPDRPSIGKMAEGRLKAIWPGVSDAFTPGKPIDLTKTKGLSMNGRYVNQQRAVKAIRANKRILLALGVGSGKTLISLGAFTDANHDGEASHALYSVPANMVGQFGSEAATYLDPSKNYKWFAKPDANQADRHKALGDRDKHFVVTTHESLRGDVVKAVAEHRGWSQGQAEAFLRGDSDATGRQRAEDEVRDPDAERKERKAAVHDAFAHKGWEHRFQYFCVDEGHKALNRQGKEDSLLAHCLDGISDNAKHYVPMTGTPIKNDLSEAYDWMTKVDPDRHPESGRADWLRNNAGVEHVGARVRAARGDLAGTPGDPKDWTNVALAEVYQRAVAPYMFQTRVPLDQPLTRNNVEVRLHGEHEAAFNGITEAYANARKARANGTYDHDALRTLSPNSYAGKSPSEYDAVGEKLHKALHITLRGAYNRALHGRPEGNDKLDALSAYVGKNRKASSYHTTQDGKAIKGKPGIVFAHNLDAVAAIKARLEKDGHRVGVITGEMSQAEKDRVKAEFQPPNYKSNLARGKPDQDAKHDVLICSDAVSAGADLPRAEWVAHYDIPDTAAVHEQRTARAHRLSSEHPVEMTNFISHTPYEQSNWMRLKDKYALSDVSQNPAEKMDDTGRQKAFADGQQVALAQQQRQQAQQGDLMQRARDAIGPGNIGTASEIQRALGVGYTQAADLADRLAQEREGKGQSA